MQQVKPMGIPVWDQAIAEALAKAPERERVNRQVKASKLAAVFIQAGVTPDVLPDLAEVDWERARTIAGIKRAPSDLTRALVARIIAETAKADAELEELFDRLRDAAAPAWQQAS